jgi:hypothetical protein
MIFATSNSQYPLEIRMREDGDNSAQSEQMLSALALVLHCTRARKALVLSHKAIGKALP